MDINEIVSNQELTAETLTEEQKTALTENAADLSDDDAKRFGIEKPAPAPIKPEVRSMFESAPGKKKAEEDEEMDPEDEEKINKVVHRIVAPLQQASLDAQNSIEVDAFIRENSEKYPMAGKFRATMLEYMKHPAYSRIPASNIFNIVAGAELVKLGAQREREASAKARGTQVRSSSSRPASGQGKDWGSASKEEFEAKRMEILGRPS